MQWWGHNDKHGWVVLDRSYPGNEPGLKESLLFFRCRDSTTFTEKRKNWTLPLYKYAPNFIRDLGPAASAEAAAELAAFQLEWPESQRKMHQVLQDEIDQAEALRTDAEKQERAAEKLEKAAAREKKKQAALVHADDSEDPDSE